VLDVLLTLDLVFDPVVMLVPNERPDGILGGEARPCTFTVLEAALGEKGGVAGITA